MQITTSVQLSGGDTVPQATADDLAAQVLQLFGGDPTRDSANVIVAAPNTGAAGVPTGPPQPVDVTIPPDQGHADDPPPEPVPPPEPTPMGGGSLSGDVPMSPI